MVSIFILGGTGNTGSKLAELLVKNSDVLLTLGSRSLIKLEEVRDSLITKENKDRLHIVSVDVHDQDTLKPIFMDHDLVVVTAAVTGEIQNLAKLAIETKTDMLDVIYSQEKFEKLHGIKNEIKIAGRCFITEAGFHPGIPSALVRWAATQMDTLTKANIYGVIRENWGALDINDSTVTEFLDELRSMDLSFYRNKKWKRGSVISMKGFTRNTLLNNKGSFWFSPMFFQEMKALPNMIESLEETGFFIAGFHWFIDYFIFPLVLLGLTLLPTKNHERLAQFFFHRLAAVSKPPFYTLLMLEAEGMLDGHTQKLKLQISHENGYWFTAIPVAAAIEQWINPNNRKPGLHLMGHFVDTNIFFPRLEALGIQQTNEAQ